MGTIFPMWGSSEQTHLLKPDMRVYLLSLAVSPHTETPHPLTNIPRATACERAHQFCKNLGCVVPKQRTEDWVDGPLYHKLGRTLACSPEAANYETWILHTLKNDLTRCMPASSYSNFLFCFHFFHSYTILCQIKWLQLDFIVCLHD